MERKKYPRTYHLPWSPGKSDDDKVISDLSIFEGKEVVITEKMDGENTTIYPDGFAHARSIDSKYHASRSWVKRYASELASKLDSSASHSLRFCGENLFAKHSISYDNLRSYFLLFNMWSGDICLDWDTTKENAKLLDIPLVYIMYQGVWDELLIRALPNTLNKNQEGFVVRLVDEIHIDDWSSCVAKWVRPNHVQTDQHWMNGPIIKNKLK